MKNRNSFISKINPYLLVSLSFLLIILIGSFLLCMPFCQTSGNWDSYINTLFTATSATCVTGLHPYTEGIGNHFTFAGQLIILIMIQIGGLGFVTVLAFFVTLFKGKLQFKDRFVLSQMVNSAGIYRVVAFIRKVILVTLIIEGVGICLGLPVTYAMYPNDTGKAVWNAVFLSISAYNNAGFDLFGGTSLIQGLGNVVIDNLNSGLYYYMLFYLSLLIILGGIGFFVIFDVISFKKRPKQWRVNSKIVLSTTAFLIVFSFVIFLLSDGVYGLNPMHCYFQGVTCRTAGFASFNQDTMSTSGVVFSCLLMFVGGSPVGTAGGIKTTTMFVMIMAVICYIRGKTPRAFNRTFSNKMILKAMTLVFISLIVITIAYVGLISFEDYLDIKQYGIKTGKGLALAFEAFSAFGTTGLSIGVTPYLTIGSKIILIVLMFIGRVGPLSFLHLMDNHMDQDDDESFKLVEEDFLIG